MRSLRYVLGAGLAGAIGLVASSAVAAPPGSATCSGGTIAPGTYTSLTVSGVCWVSGGTVTVTRNLVVEDGAALNDHAASPLTTVHVGGNVLVGKGGIVGLGT